jgi:hypothetical protein
MEPLAGYGHPAYADALSDIGVRRRLPKSGGQLLVRNIVATGDNDAIGCYPLFVCRDWSRLEDDLQPLDRELVSITIVTDPFGAHTPEMLRRTFSHVVEFKQHVVIDMTNPHEGVSRHHRYYARRTLRSVEIVEIEPLDHVDEWMRLYAFLAESRSIPAFHRFSRASFEAQFAVPGIVAFAATIAGRIVGIHLWYVIGEIGYSHLLAVDDRGYETTATYALYWSAFERLQGRARTLDLGGTPGNSDRIDGLALFKRGWSPLTRCAYLCGRIGATERYERNVRASGRRNEYFPAYRDVAR